MTEENMPNPRTGPSSPAFPLREFPRVIAGEDDCKACGVPLKGSDQCPMCGWKKRAGNSEATVIKCPFCGSTLKDDVCPACGRSLGELETEREVMTLECVCPACFNIISLSDDACPHCGTRIWIDLDPEKGVPSTLRCPRCGAGVEEEYEHCTACGFQLWPGDIEGIDKIVLEAIMEAEFRLRYALGEGTKLEKLVGVLEETRKLFDRGNFRRAKRYAELVSEASRTVTMQFKMFQEAIVRAEDARAKVADMADVSEVDSAIGLARALAGEGAYREALRLAVKGRIEAEKLRESRAVMRDQFKEYK